MFPNYQYSWVQSASCKIVTSSFTWTCKRTQDIWHVHDTSFFHWHEKRRWSVKWKTVFDSWSLLSWRGSFARHQTGRNLCSQAELTRKVGHVCAFIHHSFHEADWLCVQRWPATFLGVHLLPMTHTVSSDGSETQRGTNSLTLKSRC